MAKTKTPFFSLGSQGSVGRSITTQRRSGQTLVRGKPLPTDPYSLPQAYQRWLYQDYAYLWRQQSQATRQTYATGGAKLHLTAFQYWMRIMLTTMPDIAALWHMDTPDHTIVIDHSPNNNHGTVFGATPTTGLIDGALYFDGINDYISVPNDPSLTIPGDDFTLEFLIKPALTANQYAFAHGTWPIDGFLTYIRANGQTRFDLRTVAGALSIWTAIGALTPDTWQHLLYRKIGAVGTIWKDGQDITLGTHALQRPITPTAPFLIGRLQLAGYFIDATIDHIIYYTRALDLTEITRHSLRRYPAE